MYILNNNYSLLLCQLWKHVGRKKVFQDLQVWLPSVISGYGDDDTLFCGPHSEVAGFSCSEVKLPLYLMPVGVVSAQAVNTPFHTDTEAFILHCLTNWLFSCIVGTLGLQCCRWPHQTIWRCSQHSWWRQPQARLLDWHLSCCGECLDGFTLVHNTPLYRQNTL